LAALTATGSVAHGQEGKEGFNLRLNATWTDPKSTNYDDGDRFVRIEANTAETFGLALSGEFRISDRLGVEAGIQAANKSEVRFSFRAPDGANLGDPLAAQPEDNLSFTIVDAALNVYLTSGTLDFYVGPVLGYIFYDDTLNVLVGNLSQPASFEIDDDFAYGAVVGVDIDIADSNCFFTSSVKYLVASYDIQIRNDDSSDDIDFDPWIVRLGFGYRF
jgi:outer membrane protein W